MPEWFQTLAAHRAQTKSGGDPAATSFSPRCYVPRRIVAAAAAREIRYASTLPEIRTVAGSMDWSTLSSRRRVTNGTSSGPGASSAIAA